MNRLLALSLLSISLVGCGDSEIDLSEIDLGDDLSDDLYQAIRRADTAIGNEMIFCGDNATREAIMDFLNEKTPTFPLLFDSSEELLSSFIIEESEFTCRTTRINNRFPTQCFSNLGHGICELRTAYSTVSYSWEPFSSSYSSRFNN